MNFMCDPSPTGNPTPARTQSNNANSCTETPNSLAPPLLESSTPGTIERLEKSLPAPCEPQLPYFQSLLLKAAQLARSPASATPTTENFDSPPGDAPPAKVRTKRHSRTLSNPTPGYFGGKVSPHAASIISMDSTTTCNEPGPSCTTTPAPVAVLVAASTHTQTNVHTEIVATPMRQRKVDDADTCPTSGNERKANCLHYLFPRRTIMHCTEPDCPKVFPYSEWKPAKKALLSHLRWAHQLTSLRQVRWCTYCRKQCNKRISNHECMKGMRFYSISQSTINKHQAECPRCFTSGPSTTALANHQCSPRHTTSSTREPNAQETHTMQDSRVSPSAGIWHHKAATAPPTTQAPEVLIYPLSQGASTYQPFTHPTTQTPPPNEALLTIDTHNSSVSSSSASDDSILRIDFRHDSDIEIDASPPTQTLLDTPPTTVTRTPPRSTPEPHYNPVANATTSTNADPQSRASSPALSINIDDELDSVLGLEASPNPTTNVGTVTPSTTRGNRTPTRTDTPTCSANHNARQLNVWREGTTLNFSFPIRKHVACPELNCTRTFVHQSWSGEKQKLLLHLRDKHNLDVITIRRWCRFCCAETPAKVSLHPCLRGSSIFVPEDNHAYEHECNECRATFPTKRGLTQHQVGHKRESIARRRQPTNTQSNRRSAAHTTSPPYANQPGPSKNDDEPLLTSPTTTPPLDLPPPDCEGGTGLEDTLALDFANTAATAEASHSETASLPHPDTPSPSAAFARRFKALHENHTDEAWLSFQDLLEEYIGFVTEYVKLPTWRTTRSSQPLNTKNPKAIQRLYKKNRRRAIRLITGQTSSQCSIPVADIAEHFCQPAPCDPPGDVFVHLGRAPEPPYSQHFTPEEVWTKLRTAENSAPGPDRLTYHHWRCADPESKTLAVIFNLCLHHGKVPHAWKNATTILIPKDGDPSQPKNWRPIALTNTIMKLFTGCIARRLTDWAVTHELLSPCQKGFLPYDGAFENTYVLTRLIQKARTTNKELCLASLDISNAFGSVPHAALFAALQESGIGATLLTLIKDLYADNTTAFLNQEGCSEPYKIETGVKQGCPLSGILFNFAIDPVLRQVQGCSDEYKALAFADDIMLIAASPTELQHLIDKTHNLCTLIGLKLNPSKCVTMHLAPRPMGCKNTIFSLQDQPIHALEDGEETNFLGKPFGYCLVRDPNSLDDFKETATQIFSSALAPWQQIDAIKTFLYPSLAYAQRTKQFTKVEWEGLDQFLRPLIKKALNVPRNATNHYLHGHTDQGLFGIPLAAEDHDIACIDSAFKLLTSNDPRVKRMAWSELRETVKFRSKAEPTESRLADFLCGTNLPNSNQISNTWTHARKASSHLKITWNLFADESISITCDDLVIHERRKIFKSLRNHFKSRRSAELADCKHQGKTLAGYSKSKSSSHFNRTGDFLRFTDWRFIHRARLSLVPLNGYTFDPNQSKQCRRCEFTTETLPHVICHCKPSLNAITKRHNLVVERIKNAALGKWNIYLENQPAAGTALRPDLILTKGDEAIILDVAVPFENGPNAFIAKRREKETKYIPVMQNLSGQFKKVTTEAIIVGALGSWDRANDRILNRICSKKYAKLLRKLAVSDVIRASRDIYTHHITGIHQTQDPRYYRLESTINMNLQQARQTAPNASLQQYPTPPNDLPGPSQEYAHSNVNEASV